MRGLVKYILGLKITNNKILADWKIYHFNNLDLILIVYVFKTFSMRNGDNGTQSSKGNGITTNLTKISHSLQIFELSNKLQDDCIANRKFTRWYIIKLL